MISDGSRTALGLTLCAILMLSCDNFFIERTAGNYYPLDEGNWWRYSSDDLYDPHTVLIEVLTIDTLLQVECYPVSYSGHVMFYDKSNEGIRQYVEITHMFSGQEYTVVEGFVKRLELPLVEGSSYYDSLCGILSFFGDTAQAHYRIHAFVTSFEDDQTYGSVYKVAFTTTETMMLSDTTITTTTSFDEYYAPEIGLVRFRNQDGMYDLVEYDLQ